jgi:hypothetical protein
MRLVDTNLSPGADLSLSNILFLPCVNWKYGANVFLIEGCLNKCLSGISPNSNSTVMASLLTYKYKITVKPALVITSIKQ